MPAGGVRHQTELTHSAHGTDGEASLATVQGQ